MDIHKHVCWHQLRRLAGFHHEEDKSAIVDNLLRLYIETIHLVEDYSPTEIRPNDAYVLLSAHLLWQLWTETLEDKYFWKAVVFLQSALKKSPANYHFRFMLIKFFNQSGKT
jgi:hypothetical protein